MLNSLTHEQYHQIRSKGFQFNPQMNAFTRDDGDTQQTLWVTHEATFKLWTCLPGGFREADFPNADALIKSL